MYFLHYFEIIPQKGGYIVSAFFTNSASAFDLFDIFKLLGGLAFFLFGMNLLGEGLEKTSGGRLEKTLEKMTNTRIKGFLLGCGVTAIIQSSSATTVMVVGFVNSGIMKLKQAVGIIIGANMGTVITSWILSLTGIQGESFLIQLVKPSTFAPLLAIIGVAMIMMSKRSKIRNIATIMVGFGILMTGMEIMSDSVAILGETPAFTNILTMFNNPILGILTGTILTAIIQSSSASIGILQALSSTGSITYGMAIPIILGQNLGTCITAIISCLGAKKNAKRAAFVHLYYNIIGISFWAIAFYVVNFLHPFAFLENYIDASGIAVVHTVFNILEVVLLLPAANLIEKLARITIRDKDEESNLPFLDERFLDTPSIATEQCKEMACKMVELCKINFTDSLNLLDKYDENLYEKIVADESLIDTYEDVLGSYLVKLCSKSLNGNDSREVSKLLLCINDFERISDHAVNIANSAKEMHDKNIMFSEYAVKELDIMKRALNEIVGKTATAFCENNTEVAVTVEPLEQVIDRLQEKIKARHIKRLKEGTCTVELGFIHSDVITSLQRVSDHCSNIAIYVIQINLKQFETHEYLQEIKTSDEDFKKEYNEYKFKYRLPEITY